MRTNSALSKLAWLSAMKQRLGAFTDFGHERFTGVMIGSFFRVTYHSGHEWNRRISNEKNTAIGFVVAQENGCQLRFVRTKGLLYPGGFLLYWVILWAMLCVGMLGADQGSALALAFCAGISFLVMAITALLTAFFECFTEQSQQGQKILTATLIDPSDPFAYLTHQNQL